ncbi:hypothetical protein RIF29_03630 [Crotalaria pallida]|uniref:Uncharacterized protein n=1 Tax=Crotalaria pallida TaxID=3830 RepID=A0AAN9P9J9_CROPI
MRTQRKGGNPENRAADSNRFNVLQNESHDEIVTTEPSRGNNVARRDNFVSRPQRTNNSKQAKESSQRPKQNQTLAQSQKASPNVRLNKHVDKAVDLPKVTVQDTERRKEREASILKIVNQKQNEIWENYQARKSYSEDILRQHVHQKSEEELAHINNLLKGGSPSSTKKPLDIYQNEENHDLVMQERESSFGAGSESFSHQKV